MSNLDFDFGFTAVTEEELEVVKEAKETAIMKTAGLDRTQEKCDTLYNMIKPLLNNLAKNPEKDYIHWPNRDVIIDKQIERIQAVTRYFERI